MFLQTIPGWFAGINSIDRKLFFSVNNGLANNFVMTLTRHSSRWVNLFFLWALVICFAQVYVGVHYPLDVISGALLGAGIGYIIAIFFNNYAGLVSLQNKIA